MKIINYLCMLSLAIASMSSCVDSSGRVISPAVSSVSFGVYDQLPSNYVGDAYYYQNRYYYGGGYQRGNYFYQGRQYNDRYYHGGNYYYGGRHEHRGNPTPQRPGNQEHHSDSHGRGGRNQGRR